MKFLLKIGGIITMALGLLVTLASTMTGQGSTEGLHALATGFAMVYAGTVLENLEAIADATEELLELSERKSKD